MQSGIFWGYVSLIEGIVKRLKTEIGVETKVIATGGVVSIYEGVITDIDYFDHDLTINGLLELYKRVSETEIKTETPQFYEKIEL
jgi:type III pantothenate kinase